MISIEPIMWCLLTDSFTWIESFHDNRVSIFFVFVFFWILFLCCRQNKLNYRNGNENDTWLEELWCIKLRQVQNVQSSPKSQFVCFCQPKISCEFTKKEKKKTKRLWNFSSSVNWIISYLYTPQYRHHLIIFNTICMLVQSSLSRTLPAEQESYLCIYCAVILPLFLFLVQYCDTVDLLRLDCA